MRNLHVFALGVALSIGHLIAAPQISEFMASNDSTLADGYGDFTDWIEIHNPDSTAVNMLGYHLTDSVGNLDKWTFPNISIPAGQRLVVFASNRDVLDPAGNLHTNFTLDADGEYLALVAPDSTTLLTEFGPSYPVQFEDQSYGGSPFGTSLTESFVAEGGSAQYHVPADGSLGSTWQAAGFDDSAWNNGTNGLGWETTGGTLEVAVTSNITADMRSINASGYFRFPFNYDDTGKILQSIELTMKADDGFVAYLNGTEVASFNAPATPAWNSTATGSRSDALTLSSPHMFDLSAHTGAINSGANVLAIQGMNTSAGGSDLLVLPELEAVVQDNSGTLRDGYFDSPTPGTPNSNGQAAGPILQTFTDKPDRPAAGTDLIITAEPIANNAAVTSITLFYRVMYGAESSTAMRDNGIAPDATAGDGIYSGAIPGGSFNDGEMVRWRFETADTAGFTSTVPPFKSATDSHQYVGTVAIDPAVDSLLPVVELFMQNIAAGGNVSGTRGAVFYLGELYDNIYMNRHGQSTGGFPKKSYNLDFNKTQRFRWHPDEKRVKDIDLLTNWADKSKVRHVLSWEIMRESGVAAHFAFTTRVQNNGDFFSTADFVEDADDIYLERAGLNTEGSLYKIYDNTLVTGNSTVSPAVEQKNGSVANGQDLGDFIAGLNTGSVDAQWDFIYDNVDLAATVNVCAANCVIRNTDMHRKNWYIYRDSGDTDEWRILPWDLDLAHGRKWNTTDNYFDNAIFSTDVVRVGTAVRLVSQMWARPEVKEMLDRRIRTLTDRFIADPSTPYASRWYERRLDEQSALIDPPGITPSDAQLDFEEWGSWIQSSSAQRPYTDTHPDIEDMAEGIQRLKDEYLPGRRSYMYGPANMPAPQSGGISLVYTELVGSGATAAIRVPTDASEDASWTGLGFNDSGWPSGPTGAGFDRGSDYDIAIGTDVETEMGSNATVYMRVPFTVANPADYQDLRLDIYYDDGFVAYLNGTEVASANAPASPVWNSTSDGSHEADVVNTTFAEFDLSAHVGLLQTGSNVLAIHGMNVSVGSSDMIILPELQAGSVVQNGSAEPMIAFGAIEFAPASGNQDEEYVELMNTNAFAVDVSEWTVSDGIELTIPAGTVIPAGDSLYLSPDHTAFRARATSPTGGEKRFLSGTYKGHLSSLGETLVLSDHTGALNNTITYVGDPSDLQLHLVVSEIMYHPASNSLAEYIELYNTSDTVTLDLTGVTFTGGVDFDFTGSAITSLAPGERVLVVRDPATFDATYGAGLPVAGAFANATALSNGGEEIKLEDPGSGTIREFTYNDKAPWPISADGTGASLILIDPDTTPDHDEGTNWRAGNPGPGVTDPDGFSGDPTADSDGDRLSALLEYALGTDDASSGSGWDAWSVGELGGAAVFSYQENTAAADITYTVETSTDGIIWVDAAGLGLAEVSRVTNGDGTETVSMSLPSLISGEPDRFFRLRATK